MAEQKISNLYARINKVRDPYLNFENQHRFEKFMDEQLSDPAASETMGRETLYAMQYLGSRILNDGDRIRTRCDGYNDHELAAMYLAKTCGGTVAQDIRLMWDIGDKEEYTSLAMTLFGDVTDHLAANPELFSTSRDAEWDNSRNRSIEDVFPKGYMPDLEEVRLNGMVIQYVDEPTSEMCMAAVESNFRALGFVKEQTPEMKEIARKQDPHAEWYFDDAKHDEPRNGMSMQEYLSWMEDLSEYGPWLMDLPDNEQTAELCMTAVQASPDALYYAADKFWTPEICAYVAGNTSDDDLIERMERKTGMAYDDLIDLGIEKGYYSADDFEGDYEGDVDEYEDDDEYSEYDEDKVLEAVRKDGLALRFDGIQTAEICHAAVTQNGMALQYVGLDEATEYDGVELRFAAVEQNGLALQYVEEQTPEVCREAVYQNGLALQYVEEQTPEICMLAVKQNGLALEFVKDQNAELWIAALEQNPAANKFIKLPDNDDFTAGIESISTDDGIKK